MYAHGLKIEMLNNEKVFESKQANALNRMVKEDKFEDTKGVIRSCNSKKDRQCNGQKKKD
jgi:hypothetical protein